MHLILTNEHGILNWGPVLLPTTENVVGGHYLFGSPKRQPHCLLHLVGGLIDICFPSVFGMVGDYFS